ncbi:hypothetical protein [Streptomyces sp. NPDC086519]|uniref:hypothetical protein n=1 Tax=Streptomyces sp. NPDC086519 TaxID=3154863 RepID=UPI003441BDF0
MTGGALAQLVAVLMKGAARLRGRSVGPVRAPLTDPSVPDLAALRAPVTAGLDPAGAAAPTTPRW